MEFHPLFTIGSVPERGVPIFRKYEFNQILSVTMDDTGNLYVLDFGDTRVVRFDRDGKFLGTFGEPGQGPEGFTHPCAIMFNPFDSHIYVLENFGFSLKEFRKNGRFIKKITLKHQFAMHQGYFIAKNQLVLINPNNRDESPYYTVFLIDLATGNVTRKLDRSEANPLMNASERIFVQGGKLQVVTGDCSEVREFRLSDGSMLNRYPVEGHFQAPTVQEVHRGAMRGFNTWIYTIMQPFDYNGKHCLFVHIDPNPQDVDRGCPGWKMPYTDLYELRDGKFRKKTHLKSVDGMMLTYCGGDRLVFSGWEPDPFVVVFQLRNGLKSEKPGTGK